MTLENAPPVAPVHAIVTRPAFRYYGGKWKLAPWIISKFPRHQHYVEPCGGAASVLLQKPISPIETYNDLNGDVVNFFKVLRERPEDLAHVIRWTPWARQEFEASRECVGDELERARRFWVYQMMGVDAAPGKGSKTGFRRDSQHARNTCDNRAREDMLRNMFEVAERLRKTQIESRPMNQLIMELDGRGTLFYVDPPYVADTRTHGTGMYGVEWSDSDHAEFIEIVQNLEGFCVISGYACEMYEPLEKGGWVREEREAQNNNGDSRIESLWLCPRTVEASSGMLF